MRAEDLIAPDDTRRKTKRMVDEVLRALHPMRNDRQFTARIRRDIRFGWFLDMDHHEAGNLCPGCPVPGHTPCIQP